MSSHRTVRQGFAVVLATLALAACGGGMGAQAEPQPASVAAESAARRDECGTAERPCILQEIRVSAAAE